MDLSPQIAEEQLVIYDDGKSPRNKASKIQTDCYNPPPVLRLITRTAGVKNKKTNLTWYMYMYISKTHHITSKLYSPSFLSNFNLHISLLLLPNLTVHPCSSP